VSVLSSRASDEVRLKPLPAAKEASAVLQPVRLRLSRQTKARRVTGGRKVMAEYYGISGWFAIRETKRAGFLRSRPRCDED
jgi:hypothetical protein